MLRHLCAFGMLCILVLATIPGCGGPSGPPPTAQVTGSVTFGGKPVTTGEIWFVATDKGYSANGPIDSSGKFNITENLPPADYKVFITPPRITKPPMPGDVAPAATPLGIPDRYQVESMSGLTATIKAGPNTKDFPLE